MHEILITLLCLVGWILASAAGIFAIIELLARWELRRLAVLAAILVVAVFVAALAGATVAGIEGIAAGLPLAMIAITVVLLRWAFAAEWRSNARLMLGASGRELAVLVGAFAPSALLLLGAGDETVASVGAAALAAVLVVFASRLAWPEEFKGLVGLTRRPRALAHGRRRDEAEPTAV